MISVFGGSGFVGSAFLNNSKLPTSRIARNSRTPASRDILYLISTTHNYNVQNNPLLDAQTNIMVLLETLEQFKRTGGIFNFVSSWFVYGPCALPAAESSPCDPRGFYSITKRTAEQLIISFCETFNLQYRILRLANVIGPGDKYSAQKNALQYLIAEMAANRPVQLYQDGKFFRDYLYVTDVVRAIDLCLEKAPTNTIVNIGSGNRYLFRDLILQSRDILGSKSIITSMQPTEPNRKVLGVDFYMDISRLENLGFKPSITINDALKQICRYETNSLRV